MSDSPKADEARDDFILQERLSGRSARSISKELHCPVSEIDESLDRTLPKITNEAKRRMKPPAKPRNNTRTFRNLQRL